MKKPLAILAYFILILSGTYAQTQAGKPDLAFYINFLEKSQYIDTLSLENIFLLSKRSGMRKIYIQSLKAQEKSIQNKIDRVTKYINDLETQLDRVKRSYAQMLVFTYLYKRFFPSNLVFIFSAKSFNQAYLRIKFLQLSTKYLKSLTQVISMTKQELQYQKKILQQSLEIRRRLIKKIQYQQSVLQEEYAMLAQIKQDSKQYKSLLKDLKNYQLVSSALNRSIINEINLEQGTLNTKNLTDLFARNKGFLKPPLKNALVVIPFGVHEHPRLKSIKVRNDGIDLTSPGDSVVKAVFTGKITNIITLPNNRRAVLVNHGEYFTVYSNLVKVFVNPGQEIKTGQSIGTIKPLPGEKYPVLNFQIWHNTEKLNPEDWLNI